MKKWLIDAGNTRIKWMLVEAGQPPIAASCLTATLSDPACWAGVAMDEVAEVWLCNVAGEAAQHHIETLCVAHQLPLHIIQSQLEQCGVRNHYQQAAQLGADRWAALLAAWQQVQGACLVVNCGTATTIDALSARGDFLGGLILPGIELMQSSLLGATAQLRAQGGAACAFPQNTADAMYSGALQATSGAIQRQYALLHAPNASLLVSGGAAAQLLPSLQALNVPLRVMDNLVLQGLLIMAEETGAL